MNNRNSRKNASLNSLILSNQLFRLPESLKKFPLCKNLRKETAEKFTPVAEIEPENYNPFGSPEPIIQKITPKPLRPQSKSLSSLQIQHRKFVELLVSLDKSFIEETSDEDEINSLKSPKLPIISPKPLDKHIKSSLLKALKKNNKEFTKKENLMNSSEEKNYNKWFMPAGKRFDKRKGAVVRESKNSPLKNEQYFYNNLHLPNSKNLKFLPFIYQNSWESKEKHQKYEELQKQVTSSVAMGKFRRYLIAKKMRVPSSIQNHKINIGEES